VSKHPFMATKKSFPRKDQSSGKSPRSKELPAEGTLDSLQESNTTLLLAPTEEEIASKFLLTREVDAQINDVEEEIRLLMAKQSSAKSFIRSAVTEAEVKSQELASTRKSLEKMYDASTRVVQERLREQESLEQKDIEKLRSEEELAATREKRLEELRLLSVERLEEENTVRKTKDYDPSQHADKFKLRDEGYLPCPQSVNNPAKILAKFNRIDELWNKLRAHAREVGRRRVAVLRAL